MKAFFGTTSIEVVKYEKYYKAIRDDLVALKCSIEFDWLEKAITIKKGLSKELEFPYQVPEIMEAISKSDFVVIEYTVPNFSSSHQILYALQKHKPTLVLRLKKEDPIGDSYLENLRSENLTVLNYTLKDICSILKEYIDYLDLEKSYKRYNIMLETKHKNYLDWASSKFKRSRSEIIRNALDKQIEIAGE